MDKRNAWQPDDERAERFVLSDHRNRDTREKDVSRQMEGLTLSEGAGGVEKRTKSKSPKRGEVADASKTPKKGEATEKKEKAKKETEKKEKTKKETDTKEKTEKETEKKDRSRNDAPKQEKEGKDATKKERKDVSPKSPKKDQGESAMSVHSHRAPLELIHDVKDFGRDPLRQFLLPKLDSFKKSDDYERFAKEWDLIKVPKHERHYRPTENELAEISAEELYEKLMFGKSEGNQQGAYKFSDSFLRITCGDRSSWKCMCNFETMMKETTTYVDFMKLFKNNMEEIGKYHNPFAKDNREKLEALQNLLGQYWDSASDKPRQLSDKEKTKSEKMWKEEVVRTEKVARKAHENAQKEMEQMRFDSGCAPPRLLKDVKDFGRDPLRQFLLPKLDSFKKSDDYERFAKEWDLIKVPKHERHYRPTENELAEISAEELYEKLMFGKSDGNQQGAYKFSDSFLRITCGDRSSWKCMCNFETMMKETTTYVDFMKLFKNNMEEIGKFHNPFANGNPAAFGALKDCYDKYEDLDLAAARKQK
ncbi:hypothetical protein MHU86_5403 [Fragilaria crotonensis]|nr:hypothetical protein MHU86_5403 [Fragilaria crotonensis]